MKRLCSTSELPLEGKAKEFSVEGKMVCVANVNGRLAALDNVCPHRGGQLGLGVVLDGKVICPWHGWAYDPQTGAIAHLPDEKIPVYPIKVEGEDVLIEL
ncbi:MAG TPA: Rieske (2Fe-2S) protein [Terriglobales bacterium]|jgi:nitrite reductase (NADH) small subunit|nr:Rieske (2Fe-2S) protein [Terriglobales bacterium]